jgi:hypothetical protein
MARLWSAVIARRKCSIDAEPGVEPEKIAKKRLAKWVAIRRHQQMGMREIVYQTADVCLTAIAISGMARFIPRIPSTVPCQNKIEAERPLSGCLRLEA